MRRESDNRPVLCVLDLDVLRVDAERRGRVFEEVVKSVGPTDGSVMLKVSKKNSNYTSASLADFLNHRFYRKDYPSFQPLSADATTESVLADSLSQKFGPVRFVRRLRDFVWAGFASNAAALNAAAAGRIQVGGSEYQGGDRFAYDLCTFHWC